MLFLNILEIPAFPRLAQLTADCLMDGNEVEVPFIEQNIEKTKQMYNMFHLIAF
jgi:hypothetical protein